MISSEILTALQVASDEVSSDTRKPESVRTFKLLWSGMLKEQLISQLPPEKEIWRSIWMDSLRWMLLVREVHPSFTGKLISMVAVLLPVVTDLRFNPYCNFTFRYGLTCARCPVTVFGALWAGPNKKMAFPCYEIDGFFALLDRAASFYAKGQQKVFRDMVTQEVAGGTTSIIVSAIEQVASKIK